MKQVKLSLIAALSDNRVIGNNNQLPWHIPEDLQHFKQHTTGKIILMGRKTYQSIGKPLPNRTNIILTRQKSFSAKCDIVKSLEQAQQLALLKGHTELVIIGGAQVYADALDKVDKMYLTYVHEQVQGDAYFPEIDASQWIEERQERQTSSSGIDYTFSTLTRCA